MFAFDRRRVLAAGLGGLATATISLPSSAVAAAGSGGIIEDIERRTFQYFWDTTDPTTGLAPDRWPTPSFASIAAVGFALTAYPIGVARGWVTLEQARSRTLTTLRYLYALPQGPAATGVSGYKGFFYHFLDMTTGHRFGRCELSTIDTTLLMGGVLFAREWFGGSHFEAVGIRDLADRLYRRVEWDWATPRAPFVAMGWHPETGFLPADWNIYNEGMLLYLLGIGSPSHPLPAAAWPALTERFAAAWDAHATEPHLAFAPLFGHQYSHLWCDFRGIRDPFMAAKGIDYAENSARATRAQRAYAIRNPGGWVGYGADIWGLTACDGPGDFTRTVGGRKRSFFAYAARGPGERDDGTIAPTAALSSIAFTPDIVTTCANAMLMRYGRGICGRYGFFDAFNPTLIDAAAPLQKGRVLPGIGWVDGDHLGIDQGPIIGGIENARSGLVWSSMRRSPYLRRGLERAGFTGGWLAAS